MKKTLPSFFTLGLLKTALTTALLILFFYQGYTQVLYSTTSYEGRYGGGTIFKLDVPTNTVTAVANVPPTLDDANDPKFSLINGMVQAANGKLYGVTYYGGSNKIGSIYSFDPATSVYTNLKDLSPTDGYYPNGPLVKAFNNKLYGVTYYGGSKGYFGYGVIYSFDPATLTYTKLKDFDHTDGSAPVGNLVQVPDGKLYGVTNTGGNNDYGVIYSFDPATSTYTKLKDFDVTNGYDPYEGMIRASNGKLYGTTADGGSNGYGVIYSFDPATSIYSKLKDFDGTDGAYPTGLVQASDGKLYGMTANGGRDGYGVIFSFDPATSTYTKLKDCDAAGGNYPIGSLMQASDGKLYGMTFGNGGEDDGTGVIFSYNIPTATYTQLFEFTDSSGVAPFYTYFTEVCSTCAVETTTISIADRSIMEGVSGVKLLKFPVTLSEKSSKPVIVNYTTQAVTASAGSDFIRQSGKLKFPAGVTKLFITVAVRGDKIPESDETFNVILGNPVNATLGDGTATGTIINNNGSQLDASATELIAAISIQLSPNPASSKANLLLKGYVGNVTILISTIEGKVLKQDRIKLSPEFQQYQTDINGYPNGAYMITVIDDKGSRQSVKLIVSH